MMSKGYDSLPPKGDRDVLNLSLPNILPTLESLRMLVVDDNEDALLLTSIPLLSLSEDFCYF
jgi:hypothetical protein